MDVQNDLQQDQQRLTADEAPVPLVLPFAAIDAQMGQCVGGKAANLGEMTRAGFPVPQGFCVTTEAYARVAGEAGLAPLLDRLTTAEQGNETSLENSAATVRTQLLAAPVPSDIVEAITQAYQNLEGNEAVPVAVRSSATAEDLPFASFAGQQDTYLNVIGAEAVLDAVRRCWASLWTERAVSYRSNNGIDHHTVRLAVVIQRMVDAQVAGVLFTANPLTGARHQMVIDANPGLGEAVVSGVVNPDHFVVDARSGEIIERHLGEKRVRVQALPGGGTQHVEQTGQSNTPCLTDEQIGELARLGKRVETHYGAPQDTEWAIDSTDQLWLIQARPITTLFPLPARLQTTEESLRVYFCFNVLQGVYRPFTPMGFAALRLIASSFATLLNMPPQDALAGPGFVLEAANRFFLDITPMLRNALGSKLLIRIMGRLEARSGTIMQQLSDDSRLGPATSISRGALSRRLLALLFRARIPVYIAQVLFCPAVARKHVLQLQEQLWAKSQVPASTSASERLTLIEQLLLQNAASSTSRALFTALPAFGLTFLAGKLLGDLATRDERQTVLRALPYNPTTEMDLALWELAQNLRKDPTATHLFLETPLEQLVQAYHDGTLNPELQRGLARFLHVYGHRGVAEIDLGLPRWSEDPTHILGVLANYLQLKNPELAPDVQFRRGAQEAEIMLRELVQRAKKRGWLRSKVVGFCFKRGRALFGLREMGKYYLVILLAGVRQLLLPVGEELARTGCLDVVDDIFFLNTSEARQALAGADLRPLVRERRASYEHEIGRRHVPRVLLSDGTEPDVEPHILEEEAEGKLKGIPASAGVVTAKARVILNPVGAQLEPGEILIAPSTDPGWTPLFLTASGMVMEMGGPMSHGAVVARECGIPAVVGVPGATKHITTGQRITVDGSTGTVLIEQDAE
ncbi:MAG TPA: PEP/pyruvate-binding domain-containing protein [Ktedonobacteraceae bacterium]|nr:PEP/pyruvate-binding domain-containing protein [Ktedonobacteraceae bacterium]